MQGLRFKSDCNQPMGICVKSGLGHMVLPSTNCSCAQGLGPGRVSVPPIMWILFAIGVLLYAWLSNLSGLSVAWHAGKLGEFIMDLPNLFLALNLFGLVFIWGARYEYVKRKEEIEERKPNLSCELNK